MATDFATEVKTHPSVRRVRAALVQAGVADTITVMLEATHTAAAAAAALNCDIAEIAKAIIFRTAHDRAVLVITSGANRVDEKKVAALTGEKIGKADADFVLAQTGFVIGGVAPVAHLHPPITLLDQDLMQYAGVYPAAGHPNTMFRISPAELSRVTAAHVADIKKE